MFRESATVRGQPRCEESLLVEELPQWEESSEAVAGPEQRAEEPRQQGPGQRQVAEVRPRVLAERPLASGVRPGSLQGTEPTGPQLSDRVVSARLE